jgi:hypothetical protein
MPILAGPSVMVFIIVVVLVILSAVHAIIAAEAGATAKAENMAPTINIFFIRNLPWNEAGVLPAS